MRWLGVARGRRRRGSGRRSHDVPLRVAGELARAANSRLARDGHRGRPDRVRSAGPDRAGSTCASRRASTSAAFAERLRTLLPPGLAVLRPETSVAASASLSRSYRVNLNVLALVALFTGGLLVFSTQAHAVVRRRAQFALLRVLGVTRRRLTLLIVAEGALVGVAGSVARARGWVRARGDRRALGRRAISGPDSFAASCPRSRSTRVALVVFFALGVAAAMLGSLAAGARDGPHAPGAGAQGRRRRARVRATAPGAAGRRRARRWARSRRRCRRSRDCRSSATRRSRCC